MPTLSNITKKFRKPSEPDIPTTSDSPPPYTHSAQTAFQIRAAKESDWRARHAFFDQSARNSLLATLDEPFSLSAFQNAPLKAYNAPVILVAAEPKGDILYGQAMVRAYSPKETGRRSCFDHVGILTLATFTAARIGNALYREVVSALVRETLIAVRAATSPFSTVVCKAPYSSDEPECVIFAELLEMEGMRRVGAIEGAVRKGEKVLDEVMWQWVGVEPRYGMKDSGSKGSVDAQSTALG